MRTMVKRIAITSGRCQFCFGDRMSDGAFYLSCRCAKCLIVPSYWDVEKKGLCGAPQIRILCGQFHGSIERTVRLLGFGSDSVWDLPVNEFGHLEKNTLAEALKECRNL